MDVKEAIKWVFDIWHEWENVYGVSGEISLEKGKKMDEVIELLQCGEENKKYKKIWREIKDNLILKNGLLEFIEKDLEKFLHRMIKAYEQKYFPKPSDNFTEKVMEKINKEVDNDETEI